MIYSSRLVNAACAILILGGFAALLICSPWIGLGVLADRREKKILFQRAREFRFGAYRSSEIEGDASWASKRRWTQS